MCSASQIGVLGIQDFCHVLPGLWDTIYFTSRVMGYFVQYFCLLSGVLGI